MAQKLTVMTLVAVLLAGCGKSLGPPKIERLIDGQITCWRINDGRMIDHPWNCTEVKP